MSIRIIPSRCKPCMLCVQECVAGAWREVNGRPEMVAPELCNRCGHCVAVCPKAAIVHDSLDPLQIRRTDRTLLVPDIYLEIALGRRSIRRYRQKDVPSEIIENILYMGSHSPTAGNQQSVAYTVITDQELLNEISKRVFGLGKTFFARTRKGWGQLLYRLFKMLSLTAELDRYLSPMAYYIGEAKKGRDYILHHAPVLILVHAPRKGQFNVENCNIAAANIMNYAYASGLGTCYIGFLRLALKYSGVLRKRLQIPNGRKVHACMVLGYPAYRHTHTASRKKPEIQWIKNNSSG